MKDSLGYDSSTTLGWSIQGSIAFRRQCEWWTGGSDNQYSFSSGKLLCLCVTWVLATSCEGNQTLVNSLDCAKTRKHRRTDGTDRCHTDVALNFTTLVPLRKCSKEAQSIVFVGLYMPVSPLWARGVTLLSYELAQFWEYGSMTCVRRAVDDVIPFTDHVLTTNQFVVSCLYQSTSSTFSRPIAGDCTVLPDEHQSPQS